MTSLGLPMVVVLRSGTSSSSRPPLVVLLFPPPLLVVVFFLVISPRPSFLLSSSCPRRPSSSSSHPLPRCFFAHHSSPLAPCPSPPTSCLPPSPSRVTTVSPSSLSSSEVEKTMRNHCQGVGKGSLCRRRNRHPITSSPFLSARAGSEIASPW